uniref:BZIP domain-containing protein n=1 Tax=Steinernema glaseri TaxID=37863 RepID=A0A1I7YIB5_9BILA
MCHLAETLESEPSDHVPCVVPSLFALSFSPSPIGLIGPCCVRFSAGSDRGGAGGGAASAAQSPIRLRASYSRRSFLQTLSDHFIASPVITPSLCLTRRKGSMSAFAGTPYAELDARIDDRIQQCLREFRGLATPDNRAHVASQELSVQQYSVPQQASIEQPSHGRFLSPAPTSNPHMVGSDMPFMSRAPGPYMVASYDRFMGSAPTGNTHMMRSDMRFLSRSLGPFMEAPHGSFVGSAPTGDPHMMGSDMRFVSRAPGSFLESPHGRFMGSAPTGDPHMMGSDMRFVSRAPGSFLETPHGRFMGLEPTGDSYMVGSDMRFVSRAPGSYFEASHGRFMGSVPTGDPHIVASHMSRMFSASVGDSQMAVSDMRFLPWPPTGGSHVAASHVRAVSQERPANPQMPIGTPRAKTSRTISEPHEPGCQERSAAPEPTDEPDVPVETPLEKITYTKDELMDMSDTGLPCYELHAKDFLRQRARRARAAAQIAARNQNNAQPTARNGAMAQINNCLHDNGQRALQDQPSTNNANAPSTHNSNTPQIPSILQRIRGRPLRDEALEDGSTEGPLATYAKSPEKRRAQPQRKTEVKRSQMPLVVDITECIKIDCRFQKHVERRFGKSLMFKGPLTLHYRSVQTEDCCALRRIVTEDTPNFTHRWHMSASEQKILDLIELESESKATERANATYDFYCEHELDAFASGEITALIAARSMRYHIEVICARRDLHVNFLRKLITSREIMGSWLFF